MNVLHRAGWEEAATVPADSEARGLRCGTLQVDVWKSKSCEQRSCSRRSAAIASGGGEAPVGKPLLPGMWEAHLTCVLLTPAGVFEDRRRFPSLLPAFCLVFCKPSSLKCLSRSLSFFYWKPNSTHEAWIVQWKWSTSEILLENNYLT